MPPTEDDIREALEPLPDPYLVLGSAKQHLADHKPMDEGDEDAWGILDWLQTEVA